MVVAKAYRGDSRNSRGRHRVADFPRKFLSKFQAAGAQQFHRSMGSYAHRADSEVQSQDAQVHRGHPGNTARLVVRAWELRNQTTARCLVSLAQKYIRSGRIGAPETEFAK